MGLLFEIAANSTLTYFIIKSFNNYNGHAIESTSIYQEVTSDGYLLNKQTIIVGPLSYIKC
jgi:hypothetical protein